MAEISYAAEASAAAAAPKAPRRVPIRLRRATRFPGSRKNITQIEINI